MEQTLATSNRQAVVRRWSRRRGSVRLARYELREALADWGLASLEGDALLVLSELMTNAVIHAHVSPGRQIETRFLPEPDGVCIQVDDASDRRPEFRPSAEGGRGLVLVSCLSDSWGVADRSGAGKSVWAVLTVPDRRRT
ncbi:ATP-binding protein [Streptomyces abikoensis]|uniref:ATP-binding protein n=1 Tax=Streptomyces abikoensis TaxID=97398 RepID=UPI0033C7A053